MSLHDIIQGEGKFPIGRAVELVVKTLRGLQAAHGAGIIHRDLKPENIMVNGDGQPVLVDFGIAKTGKGARLTQTGVLLGTPYYMSPEQITGKEVQFQSDLYSMGVVLYELLTAEVPFQADSTFMITYKHCTEAPPPPRKLNQEISESLELVVLKALEKDIAKRYQSADEFADDLEKVLSGGSVDFEVTRKRDIYSLPEFRKGMEFYKTSDYHEAREAWQRVIDGVPDPEFVAEANRWIATSYFDEGCFLDAFRRYRYGAERWPDTQEAKRVPVYLDGCCFQQLQKGEKLLLESGRQAALDCFEGMLEVLEESGLSEAEKQESHWIQLTEQRAYQIAEEVRWRNLVKGVLLALFLGVLGSMVALTAYFRYVDPFSGYIFAARWAAFQGKHKEVVSDYLKALDLRPKNVPTLVRLAESLIWTGKRDQARAYLQRVLGGEGQKGLEPENAKAHELLGDLLGEQGKDVRALAHYSRSVRADPRYPRVWLKRGQIQERLKQFKNARDSYVKAISLRDNFADAYTALAKNVWRTMGKHKKALGLLKKALEAEPSNAQAHFILARVLVDVKQARVAEESFLEALRYAPGFVDAHYHLAVLYSRQGSRDKAAHQLKQALLYSRKQQLPMDRANYLLGQIMEGIAFEKTGDEAAKLRVEAGQYYRDAVKERPDRVAYSQRLGQYYWSLGVWDSAAEAWDTWRRYAPGKPEPRLKLGQALLKAGRFEEAIVALNEAYLLAPSKPEYGFQLASALQLADRTPEARALFEAVLKASPGYLPALLGAAELALTSGDRTRRDALVLSLQKFGSQDASALVLAGRLQLLAGQVDQAVGNFERALEQSPQYVPALTQLGMVLLAQGKMERGVELLERSLRASPTQDRAREIRETLARARNGR
jgi:tetratricopeptide (TPR) repeat protein